MLCNRNWMLPKHFGPSLVMLTSTVEYNDQGIVFICCRPYQCGHCSQSFSQPSELRNHVVTHSSDRPFKCGYCGAVPLLGPPLSTTTSEPHWRKALQVSSGSCCLLPFSSPFWEPADKVGSSASSASCWRRLECKVNVQIAELPTCVVADAGKMNSEYLYTEPGLSCAALSVRHSLWSVFS